MTSLILTFTHQPYSVLHSYCTILANLKSLLESFLPFEHEPRRNTGM